MEEEGKYVPKQETTRVGDNLYDIELLKPTADEIETREIDLGELKENITEGHYFWEDRNGEKLGPAQILKDWEAAQNNPAWVDHVESIKRGNLEDPIWVTKEGFVFDGMHRLTKAFITNSSKVKVKVFETLPKSAIVNEN